MSEYKGWPSYADESEPRKPFQNRPKKGKTRRHRKFPPVGGKATNVGDPIDNRRKGK